MTLLDVPTLAYTSAVLLALGAAVPLVLRRILPGEAAPHSWLMAAALGSVGVLLMAGRGVVPSLLSIAVANACTTAAIALLVHGIRQLLAQPSDLRLALGSAVAVGIVDVPLATTWPNLRARSIVYFLFVLAWMTVALRSLLRERTPARMFLASAMALTWLIAAARLLDVCVVDEVPAILAPSWSRVADFAGGIAITFLGTVGLVLLVAEAAVKEVRQFALRDPLTGLGNRAAIESAAERELARARRTGQPLGLLLLDIDRFKLINDQHGHATGDVALREVAKALRSALRREDELARYGGEEFLAVLPGAHESDLFVVGERLRQAVAGLTITVRGRLLPVTVSIGGSVVRAGEATFEPALERSDEALYAAKANGRNRFELCATAPEVAAPKRRRSSMTNLPKPT